MTTEPERPSPHVVPRPGVLRALGVANIVFAVLNSLCIFSMSFWFVMAWKSMPPKVDIQVKIQSTTAKPAGAPMFAPFNPLMGMDDRNFVRFSFAESGVNLFTNGLMFATGIGLLNLKRWGARGWGILAWFRIALVVLFWSYYIMAVAPSFSEHMAKAVVAMISQQGAAPGRLPSVADLTRVYSIMNLIIAAGAMLISSIYPALSLWILSRPGVKAAIVDQPVMEFEQP